MSAFIFNRNVYIYDNTNNLFQGISFEGEIRSGAYFENKNVFLIYILDNIGQLWKILERPYRFQRVNTETRFDSFICGKNFCAAIDINGNIWVSSNIERDQRYVQITDNIKFINIACGNEYLLAIDNEGNLWCQGSAKNGEFGVQDNNFQQLTKVVENYGFTSVTTTKGITVCLDSQGNAWGCGNNLYFILGWEEYMEWEFRKIFENMSVKDATCSRSRLLFLTQDGRVYTCGYFSLEHNIPRQNDGIGNYQQLLENVTVDQIFLGDDGKWDIMMKDVDGNIWISGNCPGYYLPVLLQNITSTSLFNQKNSFLNPLRFIRTKKAINRIQS